MDGTDFSTQHSKRERPPGLGRGGGGGGQRSGRASAFSLAQAAASYARRGWAVFPLRPGGKEPLTPHAFQDATTDAEAIARWWARWPAANIGLALEASRVAGLDIDDPTLAEAILAACPSLPAETWCEFTPRCGLHVVVGFEEGEAPRTRHLYDAQGRRLGELRSAGAYIACWPSRTETGDYELVSPLAPWEEGAVKVFLSAEDAEAFLLGLLREVGVEVHIRSASSVAVASPSGIIPQGQRNSTLAAIAGSMRARGLDGEAIYSALCQINASRCDPPLPDEGVRRIAYGMERYPPYPNLASDSNGHAPAEALERELAEAFTDTNLARLFAELAQDRALYVSQWGWLVWDGRRWARDEGGHQVTALAMDLLPRHFAGSAIAAHALDARARLLDWARKCMSRQRLNAALELAKGLLLARPEEFDRDPFLLNCENGTIDLRTGELRSHDPGDRLTKFCPVAYRPDARAPTWERFLRDIFLGDETLIGFVQRAVGYSATADVREDCFFLCYGGGSNGKTVFLTTLRRVLGDYGQAVAPDLLVSRHERGDSHPAVLADLCGARFCMAVETEEEKRLSEARAKMLTGRDPIRARFLHRPYFEFQPTHKLWLATNHLPVVGDSTEGMWRRIRVIPFRAFFPPQKQDKELPQKLLAEGEGILAWIVEGARRWLAEGLGEAEAVREATSRYRNEMDALADWLEARCIPDPQAVTPFADLYEDYRCWCEQTKEPALGRRAFANRLTEKGFEAVRIHANTKARRGLRLRPPSDDGPAGEDGPGSGDRWGDRGDRWTEHRGEKSVSNVTPEKFPGRTAHRSPSVTIGNHPDPLRAAFEAEEAGDLLLTEEDGGPPGEGPPHPLRGCRDCQPAPSPFWQWGYQSCKWGPTLIRNITRPDEHLLRHAPGHEGGPWVAISEKLLRATFPRYLIVHVKGYGDGWLSLEERPGVGVDYGEPQRAWRLSEFRWEGVQGEFPHIEFPHAQGISEQRVSAQGVSAQGVSAQGVSAQAGEFPHTPGVSAHLQGFPHRAGVSERHQEFPHALACRGCGEPLPRPPTGRPPRWCSNACRMRAARKGVS